MAWIHCLSCSTVSGFTEAASPWRLTSFKSYLALNRTSHPLLNFNLSSSGIPANSAKAFHFWQRTSPVSRIPSPIATKTQQSIISEISRCSVCHARFALQSLWQFAWFHILRHLASSFTQAETNGCLIWMFGYLVSNCWAVADWFLPFLWYQSRISIHWAKVAFSFFVKLGHIASLVFFFDFSFSEPAWE